MEDKTDTFVYEIEVQPEEPKSVTIEVKQVPIEGEPLIELDASKHYLLEAGKEVMHVSFHLQFFLFVVLRR